MTKHRVSVLVAFMFAFGLLVGVASAVEPKATFNIPFAFTVQGTTMPAGSYEVLVHGSRGADISLRSDSRQTTRLSVMTRLAEVEGGKARLVFDRVGDVKFLSEIHLPGVDGYALQGAPEDHDHEKISASN